MLSLLPYVAGAALSPAIGTQDGWSVFGEIDAFTQTDLDGRKEPSRKVPIVFPSGGVGGVDLAGEGISFDGGKVLLNEWGNLSRVHWGTGWDELRVLWDLAQARIAQGGVQPWKVKAYIFTRISTLHRDRHGVLVPHAYSMVDEDVDLLLRSFARVEAFVEAASGGAVDVQTSFTLERAPFHGEYEGVFEFGPAHASEEFYASRFNRGDFDSVIYVFPGAEGAWNAQGTIGTTNGAPQSEVLFANGREADTRLGHTEAILKAFCEQVRIASEPYGYVNQDGPAIPPPAPAGYAFDSMGYPGYFGYYRDYLRYVVSQGVWGKVRSRIVPNIEAAWNQYKEFTGVASKWQDVRQDPWAGLPTVTMEDVAQRIGASSLRVLRSGGDLLWVPEGGTFRTPMITSIDNGDVVLNNQLSVCREGIARIGYQDRDLLFIRFDLVDFVIPRLGDHPAGTQPPANVLGIAIDEGVPVVVVDTKLSNDTLSELNLLSIGGDRARLTVLSKGTFHVGETLNVRFATEVPEARFVVTDSSGTGIPVSNTTLQMPGGTPGVRLLRAQAVLPSGERIERPFLVRVVEPVSVRRFRQSGESLLLTVANNGAATQTPVDVQLPEGWSLSSPMPGVSLGQYEVRDMTVGVVAPGGASGTFGVAVTVGSGNSPATARTTFIRHSGENLVQHTFDGGVEGWDRFRHDGGNWSVSSEQAGANGNSLVVTDSGGSRFGRVHVYGARLPNGLPDPEFAGYSARVYPYINFALRSEFRSPLALVFVVDGRRYVAMITGSAPEGVTELARVKFRPNGTWQRVSYNLEGALSAIDGRHVVTDIALGDPRDLIENQFQNEFVQKHYVDDFAIARSPGAVTLDEDDDQELNPTGDWKSSDEYLRLLAAAEVGTTPSPEARTLLHAMMREDSHLPRLNAAAVFARVDDPESVPILLEMGPQERLPYVSVMYARALARHRSAETLAALRDILLQFRAEELGVLEAAKVIADMEDPALASTLSLLITSSSWQARREGALGLGRLTTDAAAQLALTFLLEVDPTVREAVARFARVDVDPVGRRMEWGSVNDLSHLVRAANYVALTKSADPITRARGYAGLRNEDDPEIRKRIADGLGAHPSEHHVQHLQAILSDPHPEVRAAAVRALVRMPGTRTFSEFSVLAGENQPIVLHALLDAAVAGRLEMPQSMRDRLAGHRNRAVRKRVEGGIR